MTARRGLASRIVPLCHLIALLKGLDKFRPARAAQFREEIVTLIHNIDHKRFHFPIVLSSVPLSSASSNAAALPI
jgi:hypothetical protein